MEHIDLEKDRSNANTDSEGYCGGSSAAPVVRKRRVWGFWVVIVLLLGACGLLAFMWYKSDRNVDYYRHETSRIRENASLEIGGLRAENDSLGLALQHAVESETKFRSLIARNFVMIINSIELEASDGDGHIDIPAGGVLYSSQIRYIRPIITYTGLNPGKKKISIRYLNADETIRKGTASTKYYTFTSEYDILAGPDNKLRPSGWGNPKKGSSWKPGNYRLEIWCEGKCYKVLFFTVK